MYVREIMSQPPIYCHKDQTVTEAANLMIKNNFSVIPVVDEHNRLEGIVTESDFVGKEVKVPHALASLKQLFGQNFNFSQVEPIYLNARNKKISEVMTKKVETVSPDTTLTAVLHTMISKNLKRFPVVENEKVVGVITRKDLLKAFTKVNLESIKD